MKKIYIAGCGGMLGDAFYRIFGENYLLECSDIDLNAPWLKYLDFRDFTAYHDAVVKFNPDYLFHLGAHTDLEYCELNPDDAYLTNTLSVENAVLISNMLDIPLIFIGTAGIFDGKKDLYDDWDMPDPISVYGRSKYAAEIYIEKNSYRYLIVRAGWMMGGGPEKDKKFIGKLMKKINNNEKELFIVDDKLGTPTYTDDFARNLELLLKSEFWGLYNMVCTGETSRLNVAHELLRLLNIDNQIKITPVNSDYWKEIYFTNRPESERLINTKLQLRGLNLMPDWRSCLKDYLLTCWQSVKK